jgi:hypothetical protein
VARRGPAVRAIRIASDDIIWLQGLIVSRIGFSGSTCR